MGNRLKMVQVSIYGGLGNQLFQYATAKSLAVQNKAELYLCLDWFNQDFKNSTKRIFDLQYFNIKYKSTRGLKPRILSKIWRPHYITENNPFAYDEDLLNRKGHNIWLSGNWSFHSYFDGIINLLREEIIPRSINAKNKSVLDTINTVNSVSIHIRHGDYTQNSLFCILDKTYYQEAILRVKQHVNNPVFYVFSDDIDFIKSTFQGEDFIIVDINKGSDSYMDLYLMSKCKHNIIANSTFSWWAAYLNDNANKIVVAPSKWHQEDNDYYLKYRHIESEGKFYPEGWMIV